MAYPPVIYPQSAIPDIPAVYPGKTTPIPSSILEPYHSACINQYYQIYGSKNGNIYDKCFIAQYMRHDGTSLTGFGIRISKRGAPSENLIVGVTLGGPPDDPLNLSQYVETWQIPSSSFSSANTWYWVFCFPSTPIDVTHYTPMVVAASTTDYNSSSKTGDYLWGRCFGIPSGLASAEHYLPETLSASLDPCQGPGMGYGCLPEGVDITEQPIIVDYDDTPPYVPLSTIIVNNPYKVVVTMHNGQALWCENYSLDFYWDDETTYFDCYKGWFGPGDTQTIEFSILSLPPMINGAHQLLVKMREKPSVPAKIINVFVVGGPYEWSAAPDTASHFSYTQGTGPNCTNPDGSEGSWYCDGTTKKTCAGGQWSSEPNSPDCLGTGCKNPDGAEGVTQCFGKNLYKCQGGNWVEMEKDAPDCIGCDCENLAAEDCEQASANGSECCWYYQKYFWQPAACRDVPQDYLRDYLPFIVLAGGAAALLIALSTGRKPPTTYYPPPREPSQPRTPREHTGTSSKKKKSGPKKQAGIVIHYHGK